MIRSLLFNLARRTLTASGLQIRRVPRSLIEAPQAELRPQLGHVVAHHLSRQLPGNFFFLQIGAFDGSEGDPIHDLVLRHRWHGIAVEPQRDAFARLQETYRGQPQIELCNVAVSDQSGPRELFKVAPRGAAGMPSWVAQLASFQRETLMSHRNVIPDLANLVEVEIVECTTFDRLLASIGDQRIDLLQIDAEGYDDVLLRLFHETGRVAEIIGFEHKHLSRDRLDNCIRGLIAKGYRVGLNGPDTIAYRG